MLTQRITQLTEKANQLLDNCEYVQAIMFYEECLKDKPKHVEALVNASTCYLQLKYYEKSFLYLESALALEQDNILIYTNYAAVLIDLGRIDGAIKCLENALFEMDLDYTDYPLAFNNLGYAYELKEDYFSAIFHYKNAIECDYGDECTLSRVNLGNVLYQKLNDKETAFEHYEYAALLGNAEAKALLHKYKGCWCN